ncbi:hypothetical protein N8T08_002991 [Aspergillus melleus]|uniref:Uncharacterized protein n=1 Tax=Aspergillus melleus TaxID=138277 RepID=A0ACC3B892_9EURO|nr:hypothetical protein N8T08_002991 [Aspergillus melleus]
MSDQQPPVPQDIQNEGPPVKRACMNDTPPIALTPADDGSDFYNTPLATGTPVNHNEQQTSAPTQPSEPVPATSAPLIPGLNLVNNSLKDLQSVTSESNTAQSSPNPESVTKTQDQPETAAEVTKESAPQNHDAMEVEQTGEQHNQNETSNSKPEETVTNGENANEPSNAAVAGPTEHAQAEGEEGEEEHPEWEIDSSPYESSSDSSDSSDDSSSEDEDYPILSPEEQARILMQAELGSDDEGDGKGKSGGHIRTANEVLEEAPALPEVTITPDMKIVLLGNVQAIVENTVLISANTTGEYQVLEGGSLLCFEDRSVAGVVSETLGRVENPLYTVRYPDAATIEARGLTKDRPIYYVESQSTFVFTQPLQGMKGSDASNFHDEEIAEDEVEFSDDEAEAEYKRKLKQKRQEKKDAKHGDGSRAKRGPPGPSKLNQSELNYDDNAGEDGYTPLARPKNLHEMMGRQEAPVESDDPHSRGAGFYGGRGRGRGSDRGRGGRGRGGPRPQHNDRQPSHQQQGPELQPQAQPQSSHFNPQAYQQNQQPVYSMPQQMPSYPGFQPQMQQPQPQQQPFPQGMLPFNFQMPFQQAYQQPNPYQQIPSNAHINPLFFAALQQHQQQQQQYPQQQQQQQVPGQQQMQNPSMNFDQVKAQLDILRQLQNNQNNQMPPPS